MTGDIRDELRSYFKMRGLAELFWLKSPVEPHNDYIAFSLEPGMDEDFLAIVFQEGGTHSPILRIGAEDAREIIDVLEAFISTPATPRGAS